MIITYHNIGQDKGFNTVAFEAFQSQMHYLIKHYKIVTIDHYINQIIQSGKNAKDEVVITFDDGYTSFPDLVLPFLETQHIPVALFVCNGFLGKTNEWDASLNRIPIMTQQQLSRLSHSPLLTIGAHSVTHCSLSALPEAELKDELLKSKLSLEQLLERSIEYMAYPYGQYYLNVNKRVITAAKTAGYKAALTSNFKSSNTASRLFSLNRLDITGADSMNVFQQKLKRGNYFSIKQSLKNGYSFLKVGLKG
jgi:peptidoglycan/xylan/chitin deacetylase (PgdA/CDA1 family)